MARQTQRFTIFDMMDAKGYFDQNPANPGARTGDGALAYKGPQAYPKMLYHPEGKTRVVVPGFWEQTPVGPQLLGKLEEIISQVVDTPEQEKALRAEGWHIHPAHAIGAGGGVAPMISSDQRIADLEAQIKRLNEEKETTELLQLGPKKKV